jgi:hypothetical protein
MTMNSWSQPMIAIQHQSILLLIGRWCVVRRSRRYPPEFQNVSTWWQMTNSAGIKPGIRLRLWFWLDRPVTDDEAKRWLAYAPVDQALYSPVQVHLCRVRS